MGRVEYPWLGARRQSYIVQFTGNIGGKSSTGNRHCLCLSTKGNNGVFCNVILSIKEALNAMSIVNVYCSITLIVFAESPLHVNV